MASQCMKHQKVFEFQCVTHNISICSKCAIFEHKNCSIADFIDLARFESAQVSAASLSSKLEETLTFYEGESQRAERNIKQTIEWLKANLPLMEEQLIGSFRDSRQHKFQQLQSKKTHCDFILKNLDEKIQGVKMAQTEGNSKHFEATMHDLDSLVQANSQFLSSEMQNLQSSQTTFSVPMAGDEFRYVVESNMDGSLTVRKEFDRTSGSQVAAQAPVQHPVPNAPAEAAAYPAQHPPPSAPMVAPHSSPQKQDKDLPSYDEVVGGFQNLSMRTTNPQAPPTQPMPPPQPMPPYQNIPLMPGYGQPVHTPTGIPSGLTPTSPNVFMARTTTDGEHCSISGIAILRDDRIVVADKQNQKLKLFGQDFTLMSEQLLAQPPYDVAEAPSGKLAVTIPKLGDLQLYVVTDRLTLDSGSIYHVGKCQGVTASMTHLFVSVKNRDDESYSIYMYDASHNFFRSIPLKITNYGPLAVCPKHGYLYYKSLSVGKEKIYCMTTDGQVLWKTKVKSWIDQPYGFAAVNSGVLVSIDGIFFLSGGGSRWEKLGELEYTGPIAVSRDLRRLIVSHRSGGSSHIEDTIAVFTISYYEGAGNYY